MEGKEEREGGVTKHSLGILLLLPNPAIPGGAGA